MKKIIFNSILLFLISKICFATIDTLSSIKILGISTDTRLIAYENEGYSGSGDFKKVIIKSLKDPTTMQVYVIKDDINDMEIQEMSYFNDKIKNKYENIINNRYLEAKKTMYDLNISSDNLKHFIKINLDDNNRYNFKDIGYFYTKEEEKGDIYKLIFHPNSNNKDEIIFKIYHNYSEFLEQEGKSVYNYIKEFYYCIDPMNKKISILCVIYGYEISMSGDLKVESLKIIQFKFKDK